MPDDHLTRLADAVLMPCFDGTTAPDWVRRRVADSLGGVCLFARNIGTLDQVAALSASLAAERDSVVIAIDEEAGDVTRLDAATGSRFPGAAALGRVDDVAATARVARRAGDLLAAAGISLNLAPCADVALDPRNPVIGSRSFGADPVVVARHTAAWVTGQQSAGVAACAKHYPGHGDTDADTHRATAVVHGDLDALRTQALPPFAAAIDAGVAAIMPGHLLVPDVDDAPASVSYRWLTEILRGEMGFAGAIVTDALEMAAVAERFGIAGGAVRALAAGADLLCIGGITRPPEEVDAIRDAIVEAVRDGALPEERLAEAAGRSATVGRAAASSLQEPTEPVANDDFSITVSRRALDQVGPLPDWHAPALILRCAESQNIAVGEVPWGLGAAIGSDSTAASGSRIGHGASEMVLAAGDRPDLAAVREAGIVLVVTRDRHRHPWMTAVLAAVRTARPDAVLVEMGISGVAAADGPAIASFGATAANSRAVLDVLTDGPT